MIRSRRGKDMSREDAREERAIRELRASRYVSALCALLTLRRFTRQVLLCRDDMPLERRATCAAFTTIDIEMRASAQTQRRRVMLQRQETLR